jgi:hypothetical protein
MSSDRPDAAHAFGRPADRRPARSDRTHPAPPAGRRNRQTFLRQAALGTVAATGGVAGCLDDTPDLDPGGGNDGEASDEDAMTPRQ